MTGIIVHVSLQTIFHIAVVLGVMPNTGVSLPFVSYGGTTTLMLMAEMGLALSVSRSVVLK
jgi:cell division protein FtsW